MFQAGYHSTEFPYLCLEVFPVLPLCFVRPIPMYRKTRYQALVKDPLKQVTHPGAVAVEGVSRVTQLGHGAVPGGCQQALFFVDRMPPGITFSTPVIHRMPGTRNGPLQMEPASDNPMHLPQLLGRFKDGRGY